MSWFCNTEEAKEHKRTCTKNSWECGKCIWIDESSSAMSKYGTFVEQQPKKEKLIQSLKVPTTYLIQNIGLSGLIVLVIAHGRTKKSLRR